MAREEMVARVQDIVEDVVDNGRGLDAEQVAERIVEKMLSVLDAPFTTSDGSDDPLRATAQKAVHDWLASAC